MVISVREGESSYDRVIRAANALKLQITPQIMPQSTRTAQEAAIACDCEVAQIVKSLIFERCDNQELVLVLASGGSNADMQKLKNHFGCKLVRAEPRKIRELTGFAIGGVSLIGYLIELETAMDKDLITYDTVWAAAGKPEAVFMVSAKRLYNSIDCRLIDLKQ